MDDIDIMNFALIYSGSLLCHFMEVASMNSHEVGHFIASSATDPWFRGSAGRAIGSSLETSLVLLNHSCDPNILKVNVGRASVVFAARDIRTDQEVHLIIYVCN